MKRSFIASIIVATTAFLSGCQDTKSQQISYFKDSVKNRVFVLQLQSDASPAEVRKLAETKPNTEGQFTAVYVFEANAPKPAYDVTLYETFSVAMDAMYLPGMHAWRYLYLKRPNGTVQFFDCTVDSCEGVS